MPTNAKKTKEAVKDTLARELGIVLPGGTAAERKARVLAAIKQRAQPQRVSVAEADRIVEANRKVGAQVEASGQLAAAASAQAGAAVASAVAESGGKLAATLGNVEAAIVGAVAAIPAAPRAVAVTNQPDVAGPVRESAGAIVAAIVAAAKAVVEVMGAIAVRTFTVRKEAGDFLVPQATVIVDPETGKPVDVSALLRGRGQVTVAGGPSVAPVVAAIRGSLADYKVSDVDEAADPKFYGFLRADGYWYVMRNTGGTAFRYAAGSTGYAAAWAGRASLSYGYFDSIF